MTSLTVTFPSQPNATELEGQCGVDGLPVPRDAQLHPLLHHPQRGGNGQRALKHKAGLACIKAVRPQRLHQQQRSAGSETPSRPRLHQSSQASACIKVVRPQRPHQQQLSAGSQTQSRPSLHQSSQATASTSTTTTTVHLAGSETQSRPSLHQSSRATATTSTTTVHHARYTLMVQNCKRPM